MFSFNSNTKQLKELSDSLDYTKKLLTDSKRTIGELRLEISEYRQTIENFVGLKEQHANEIKKLQSDYELKIEALKETNKIVENSVNQRVNECLATIGVTSFAAETIYNNTVSTPKEHLTVFNSLNGGEKTEYFKKHSDAINRALLES